MGSIVGTAWWVGCIATKDLFISAYSGCVGAGRANIRGEVSMSVSLEESAVIRAMFLVSTMIVAWT